MGIGRLYRTEGIVIRRRDQGEADRVLTLCTPQGKLDAIAKGARKVHSRKAGHIELFTRAGFVLSRVSSSWDIVTQAETIDAHAPLRSDLVRGTYARYAIELLDRFFAQDEGGVTLFDLIDHTLTWLSEDADLDLTLRFYEQQLLALAGFRPELFRCVGEHRDQMALHPAGPVAQGRAGGFDAERGGALCPDCYAHARARHEVVALSPGGLWLLQECQLRSYGALRRYELPAGLHEDVERAIQHYITYHLERSVRSLAFLRQLRREAAIGPHPLSLALDPDSL
jgi:DNA repair protein RecO (recombination protein O)